MLLHRVRQLQVAAEVDFGAIGVDLAASMEADVGGSAVLVGEWEVVVDLAAELNVANDCFLLTEAGRCGREYSFSWRM